MGSGMKVRLRREGRRGYSIQSTKRPKKYAGPGWNSLFRRDAGKLFYLSPETTNWLSGLENRSDRGSGEVGEKRVWDRSVWYPLGGTKAFTQVVSGVVYTLGAVSGRESPFRTK